MRNVLLFTKLHNAAVFYKSIHYGLFQNEVTRWRVENSWGNFMNTNGHITMTTEWFKEYVFEIVVDKKILPKSVLDVFNQEPIVLPIWNQLGAFSMVN